MKELTKCRCCDGGPLVGHWGMCKACSDAVTRFIKLRRNNLYARRKAAQQ